MKVGFVIPSTASVLGKRMKRAVYSGPPGQNPSELFDIYPPPLTGHGGFIENTGNPIGTKERRFVHKDGDWHRAVHVWLTHPGTKSVVLQKRSKYKDTNPNKWDVSSAGHITHGDGSSDTAVKELEEELGLEAGDLPMEYLFTAVSQFSTDSVSCNEFQDVYLVELVGERSDYRFDRIGETEVSDVSFIPISLLRQRLDEANVDFVARPEQYRKRFFEILRGRYGAV
ncbi:hypothetical protein NDN08_006457 [Rhodosorus marinus]|uniref:Nudix hydrolase domain-containing protein n=1 Tax=Rhodosorus marinus TaxID=101924 RepID=A0AAV8UJ49_9RHOD|nr:hypothetical protein NDN08_006457 [Rhodosorus marinus]